MGRLFAGVVLGALLAVAGMLALEPRLTVPAPERDPITTGLQPPSETEDTGFVAVILPADAVDIRPRIEGRVQKVFVRMGDRVKKGDLLLSLEVDSLRRDLGMAEAQEAAAKTEVDRSVADLERASEVLARREPSGRAFSGEELSTSRYNVKVAQIRLAAAKAAMQEKKERIAQLKVALAHAEIRAPFDGNVVARMVDPGALVSAGTQVMRLIGDGDLWVRYAIPAEDSRRAHVGDPIRVAAVDLAEAASLRIDRMAAEIDPATRLVIAESRLKPPVSWKDHRLAGRNARVWIARRSANLSSAASRP